MKRRIRQRWFWWGAWGLHLVILMGITVVYAGLPVDGTTGDLESFTPQGFRVQWILEERPDGLKVGDMIVRAGGHTYEEWLDGASSGSDWQTGSLVEYQILRQGESITRTLRLAPVSFVSILRRWWLQFIVALVYFIFGTYVFLAKPHEMPANLVMLTCVAVSLTQWIDAFNFQFAVIAYGWPFWFHYFVEQLSYGLCFAAACHFFLVFPNTHPWMLRFPRLLPLVIYSVTPVSVLLALGAFSTWSQMILASNRIVFFISYLHIGLLAYAAIRTLRNTQSPVARAQIRWLILGMILELMVGGPFYVLPLVLGRQPLISNAVAVLMSVILPLFFTIAIFRYRLFDISIVINQSLVYGTLTVLIGAAYFVCVLVFQNLFVVVTGQRSDLAIVLSTLALAYLFQPLRARIQSVVDRRFYRSKIDLREAFISLSQEIRTIIDLSDLLRVIVNRLKAILGAAHAAIFFRANDGTFMLAVGHNLPVSNLSIQLTNEQVARLQNGHILFQPLEEICYLVAPLLIPSTMSYQSDDSRDSLIGMMVLGPPLMKGGYSSDDQALIMSLANQAGTAIYVAQLIEEKQREEQRQRDAEARRQLAETLRAVTGALTSTLNLTEVIEHLLESLARIIHYDSSAVLLVQGDEFQVIARRGKPADEMAYPQCIPIQENLLYAEILATRQPIVLVDAQQDPRFVNDGDSQAVRGWIGVPLIYKEKVIGLFTVDSHSPGSYGQPEADITFTFAGQAAIAIENARLFGEVQRMAATDSLTGINNRRYFFDLAEIEFRRSRGCEQALSTIMLDIDHFKRVNDTYGHSAGDTVIIWVARHCAEKIRKADILGRYGGEEFAVILPGTSQADACEVAERLRRSIDESSINIRQASIHITISVGVATQADDTPNVLTLLSQADTALYKAKAQGRNCVCTYSDASREGFLPPEAPADSHI